MFFSRTITYMKKSENFQRIFLKIWLQNWQFCHFEPSVSVFDWSVRYEKMFQRIFPVDGYLVLPNYLQRNPNKRNPHTKICAISIFWWFRSFHSDFPNKFTHNEMPIIHLQFRPTNQPLLWNWSFMSPLPLVTWFGLREISIQIKTREFERWRPRSAVRWKLLFCPPLLYNNFDNTNFWA